MLLLDTFVLALKNIWSNKMRTILTMLGIIIGVTAVIVIVGLGNGMTESVRQSFSAMGINSMQVNIWGRNSSRNASVDYMYGVVEDHPQYLRDISPYLQVTGGQTVKEGRDTYRYTGVYGVNEDYTAMRTSRWALTALRSWACWPPRAATPSCRRAARTTASTSPTPWP